MHVIPTDRQDGLSCCFYCCDAVLRRCGEVIFAVAYLVYLPYTVPARILCHHRGACAAIFPSPFVPRTPQPPPAFARDRLAARVIFFNNAAPQLDYSTYALELLVVSQPLVGPGVFWGRTFARTPATIGILIQVNLLEIASDFLGLSVAWTHTHNHARSRLAMPL